MSVVLRWAQYALIGLVLVGAAFWWMQQRREEAFPLELRVSAESYAKAARECDHEASVSALGAPFWTQARAEIMSVAGDAMSRREVGQLVESLEALQIQPLPPTEDPTVAAAACRMLKFSVARDLFAQRAARAGYVVERGS